MSECPGSDPIKDLSLSWVDDMLKQFCSSCIHDGTLGEICSGCLSCTTELFPNYKKHTKV